MKKRKWMKKIAGLIVAALAFTCVPVIGTQPVYADPVDHLIINQVYGGGDAGTTAAPITNCFVELYNPTEALVSLAGYSLVYGDLTLQLTETATILSGGSYLIVGKEGTDPDPTYSLPEEDQIWENTLIDNKTYTITLKKNGTEIDQAVADQGVTNLKVSKQKSLRRIDYTDTNQDSDWEVISWAKKDNVVNETYINQYAPRNSQGKAGSVYTAEPAPEYTPVVAGNTKVPGFNNGKSSLDIEQIARYNSNAKSDAGGSLEIVEYNSRNGYAYAVSGLKGKIIAVKISDVSGGDTVTDLAGTEYDVQELVSGQSGFTYGDITSVSISPDGTKLAAAVQHADYATAGIVAVFDCQEDGSLKNPVCISVGVQPDMVTFADADTVLTADEGEPRKGYGVGTTDPKGTVSIVSLSGRSSVQVDFSAYTAEELTAKNILIGKANGETLIPENDLEPEYIAVSSDGKTAYVSLQEANAIAVLDVENKRFTAIESVGFEDYGQVAVDINKDDGKYEAGTYENLIGARMPDGIAIYEAGADTYLVTANEGDSREWGDYKNDTKVTISGSKITILNSDCCDGCPDGSQVMFGGRSFSIFKVTGNGLNEVFDSGSDFERITAETIPAFFNCSNDDNQIDSRSAKKGPEPENVTIGTVNGKTYAFIAIERTGGIMVYDITDPAGTAFVNYINSREFETAIQGDVSPEGLCFVERGASGNPLLLTACEVSGTLAVYEMKANKQTSGSGTTTPDNSQTTTGNTTADVTKPADEVKAETESTTETVTNTAGKKVERTTTTTTDEDGNVTGTIEKSVIADAGKNTSVTVETVKNAAGETISAKAEATVTGTKSTSGVKGTISGSVITQITEAAETKSVTVSVTVKAGKKNYTIQTDTGNLTAGKKLRVMEIDPKTGEYTMVNNKTYTVSKSGNVSLTLASGNSYELLTEKKAKSVEKQILSTVKTKSSKLSLKEGKSTKVQMSSKLNPENIKTITYSSGDKSVLTVNKEGKVTAKKSGSTTVKVKVTLKNGKTKTLTVKVNIK